MANAIPTLTDAVAGPGNKKLTADAKSLQEAACERLEESLSDQILILQKQYPKERMKLMQIESYLRSQIKIAIQNKSKSN